MKNFLLITIFSTFILTSWGWEPAFVVGLQGNTETVDSIQNELKIYPNPVESGRVTLEMNSGEIAEIRLINIAGKEVVYRKMDFGTTKYVLTLEEIPSGIYFVSVKSVEHKNIVKKLVVSSN